LADILIAMAMTLQLRKAIGNFSSFVIVRVVRLTVETNTLTGICLLVSPTSVHLTSCLATLAITSLVLYATFPNELYYIYTYALLVCRYPFRLMLEGLR